MVKKKEEKNIVWDFIDKNHKLIYFIIISIIAIIARKLLISYQSGDYNLFLEPWFNELKTNGGLGGLAYSIGNYTPIYMTLLAILTYIPVDSVITIKILSIVFDFVGAYAAKKIVEELLSDKKYASKIAMMVYAGYLFLPTVIFNSAYWSQSDSIYTSFVLISILYLIKKNYKISMLFFGIALSFKLQAIFIFPLYVLMYISERKIKLKDFLIIPITIFVLSIPKIIYSGDLLCGFKVYIDQMGTYSQYGTLNFPNIYGIFFSGENNLITMPFNELNTVGLLITFTIFITLAYIVYIKKIKFNKNTIIEFGLFSILIATFFLPHMHERYLFMGDVIALLYLVINHRKYYVPIMIEFISLYGYAYLLFGGFSLNFSMVSILFLVLIILFTKDMYIKYLKI